MKKIAILFLLILTIPFCKVSFGQINFAAELNYSRIGGLESDYYYDNYPGYRNIVYKGNNSFNCGATIYKSIGEKFYFKTGLIINPQRFTIIKNIDSSDHHSPGYYKEESTTQIFDMHLNIPFIFGFQLKKVAFDIGLFSYHRLFGFSHQDGWSESHHGDVIFNPIYSEINNTISLQPFSKNNLGITSSIRLNIYKNLKIQIRYKHHLNIYKTDSTGEYQTKPYRQFDIGLVYFIDKQ